MKKWPRLRGNLKRYLVTGLLVLAPVYVTGWVLYKLMSADGILAFIPFAWRPEALLGFPIPGLGLILTLLLVLLIGGLVANYLGRKILDLGEAQLKRIPILRWFYFSSKEILQAIFRQQGQSFRRVVLIEFPRPGAWSVGFVTGEVCPDYVPLPRETAHISVFIPTTPNPTTGYLVVLPEEMVKPVDWTVEEAFRMVVSGGVLQPGAHPKENV